MVSGLVGDNSIATARCCGGDKHALGLGTRTREEVAGLVWGMARGRGEEGGGVRLASEADVGVEPEAMAWSATSTWMRWSWAVVGRLARRAGRERNGVRWRSVAAQAGLVRKVGPAARQARNEHGHFFLIQKSSTDSNLKWSKRCLPLLEKF
jgi:hypothetical protein